MNIVLSNYRYFISGGPERYFFGIKEILEHAGHRVYPFSVQSHYNRPNDFEQYFLSPLSATDEVYFRDYKRDPRTVLKVLERTFYSPEGFIKAYRYARKFQPDVIYSMHFLNKMSPSIIDGFKCAGVPVVVRLSDFGLICPQALLYSKDGICEKCIQQSLRCVIQEKCVQQSTLGSILKYLAWRLHQRIGSIDRIDAFVSPSHFTIQKFVEAGFDRRRFHYIPTCIDATAIAPEESMDGHILYFGRLEQEKGVHILLEAYGRIVGRKPRLIVIGKMDKSPYADELMARYSDCVDFMAFMPKERLQPYVQGARFIVIPSMCYENLPNTLLESFASAKAVIAPNHGCFPEFIKDGATGLLFTPGDTIHLQAQLEWAIANPATMRTMGKEARAFVEHGHTPQVHYHMLLQLFQSLARQEEHPSQTILP